MATQQRLAECRRELSAALAPPAPDPVAVLELSVEERLLQDRLAAHSAQLEQRVAALPRPEPAPGVPRPSGLPVQGAGTPSLT